MNIFKNFFKDFEHVIFESVEEREAKKIRMTRLFSRVFLALFVYVILSEFMATVIYTVAAFVLSAEEYTAFCNSSYITIIVNSVCQYLIAFPVFVLMLLKTDKAQPREKSKICAKDFFLIMMIGETLLFAGNLVGTLLNNVFGAVIGKIPENNVANIIAEIPIYLIFIAVVVLPSIFEELIFRKLMIDRLSLYGDRMAILFSAVAFGLFHVNLYQFFYATLLGILLGYVYTKTGNVKYTILMHMIINFFGSVVVLYVQEASVEMERLMALMESGMPFDLLALSASALIVMLYTYLQYGMVVGGVITLRHFINTKQIQISGEKEIYLPNSTIVREGVKNVGAILFIVTSILLIIVNLFAS